MRAVPTLLLTGLFLMLAAPTAGAAAPQLPVGEAEGVRIVRERGAIVVVFTPRAENLRRRVAGRRVSVICEERSGPDENGFVSIDSGGSTVRAPKRGRRVRTGDGTRGMDLCRIWLAARTVKRNGSRTHYARILIVSIPLTQKGAIRLDEEGRTTTLVDLLTFSSIFPGRQGRPGALLPTQELVARVPRVKRPIPLAIVPLTTPADTPPPGSAGYYGDGAEHAAAVVVSLTGRRLFVEVDADDLLRTNVAEYVFADQDDYE